MRKTKKAELKVFGKLDKLRRGDVTVIARRSWCSPGHVSNVLHGRRRDNDDIIRIASDVVKGRRKK